MKKTKNKFKNMIELQLNSNEILEFLDFLKVAESGGLHCSSATKIKAQFHEFVVSRIEGRNPKAYVTSTDDLVSLMDQKSLQKLAFSKTNLDKISPSMIEKYKGFSPQEIIDTMNVPLAEKVVTAGELNAVARKEAEQQAFMKKFTQDVRERSSESGLGFVKKVSDATIEELTKEVVSEMNGTK